jgi:hypothetical protein
VRLDEVGCVCDAKGQFVAGSYKSKSALGQHIAAALNSHGQPLDIVLFCPNCSEQHIDEPAPEVCQDCGHREKKHSTLNGCLDTRTDKGSGRSEICGCTKFNAWLNPPHKSHRCHFCNHVFRPSDQPTNGVREITTRGENDGNPRPRYFATAKDFSDALLSNSDTRKAVADELGKLLIGTEDKDVAWTVHRWIEGNR